MKFPFSSSREIFHDAPAEKGGLEVSHPSRTSHLTARKLSTSIYRNTAVKGAIDQCSPKGMGGLMPPNHGHYKFGTSMKRDEHLGISLDSSLPVSSSFIIADIAEARRSPPARPRLQHVR